MSRLVWNAVGSRTYETGLDRGVLYLDSQPGVAWNGLTGVSEAPSGGDIKNVYIDGIKILNYSGSEEFEATVSAFTYPVEFAVCDGTARPRPGLFVGQQRRKSFGLSYRTKVGNDLSGDEYAYKIHLVYNALVGEPTGRDHGTLGKDSDVSDFSWKITTKPMTVPGYKATSHLVLDSRYIHPITLGNLENVLYGNDTVTAHLPTWTELIALLDEPVEFTLTDNGDGSFEIDAPNDILTVDNVNGLFSLTWPNADYNGDGTYTIGS